eukprot:gene26520-32049_t
MYAVVGFLLLLSSFGGYFVCSKQQKEQRSVPNRPQQRHSESSQGIAIPKEGIHGREWLPKYNGEKLHIVFSTSCHFAQHWQSFLLFHSAMVVNQPGDITRIASGCSKEKQKEIAERTKVLFPQYRVHFAPDYSVDAKSK